MPRHFLDEWRGRSFLIKMLTFLFPAILYGQRKMRGPYLLLFFIVPNQDLICRALFIPIRTDTAMALYGTDGI